MYWKKIVTGWLVLAGAQQSLALEPVPLPSQHVVRKWGAEALRDNTVHALIQTRDHYLWIGTNAGLLRYDGNRFTLFNVRNTPVLGDGGASVLAEGPQGDLFIGTTSGRIVRYRDGVFEKTAVPPGTAPVTALHASRDGSLWSSTFGSNVTQSRDGQVRNNNMFPAQGAGVIVADPSSKGVWIGTRLQGLVHLDEKEATPYAMSDAIRALVFDHEGVLWVGTSGGLLRRRPDGGFARVDDPAVAGANVTALLEDRDHNLWAATEGRGLCRLAAGRWTQIRQSFDSLSDDDVESLLEDHEGNLWVGTANGLNRLSNGTFITYGPAEGMGSDVASAIAPGRNGVIWIGTQTAHLLRWSAGKIERYEVPNPPRGSDKVIALHEAPDGSVWMALDSRRVFRFTSGRFVERTAPVDLGAYGVRAFFDGENGETQFLVTRIGIAHMDPRTLAYTPVLPGRPKEAHELFPHYPHIALRDRQGATWLADVSGLARHKDGNWTFFNSARGMPAGRIRWMTFDAEDPDALWAATASGLAYVRGDVVRSLTLENGLPEGYLCVVLDDRRGGLWITSTGSLFRLEKREVLDFFAGRVSSVTPRVFDASDGLRTTTALLSNNLGLIAEDGRLWFATKKGLVVVDPARRPTNTLPPDVHIEALSIDDKPYDVKAAVVAPPGRGDLAVHYTGLSYTVPERVCFRYKLEGHDPDWIQAGDRRAAFYTSLRPGLYRFRVTACNNDGVWNEIGRTIEFRVAPHFYQTSWFLAGCGMLTLGLVLAVHNGRVRYLKAREKVLARRVEEAVAHISTLRGLLPICASCKKVRDDTGYWNQIEIYLGAHTDAEFTHSVCPDCLERLYPEYANSRKVEAPHV